MPDKYSIAILLLLNMFHITPNLTLSTDSYTENHLYEILSFRYVLKNQTILVRHRNTYPFNDYFASLDRFSRKPHKFKEVRNLNTWISQLLHNRNCFTLIDNWEGVDFSTIPIVTPVIIRRPEPAIIIRHQTRQNRVLWVSKMKKGNFKTIVNASNPEIPCDISKLYISFNIGNGKEGPNLDLCVRLDILRFSSNTRPWNCEINFAIHTPIYLTDDHTLDYTFSYPKHFGYRQRYVSWQHKPEWALKTKVPPIMVFISDTSVESTRILNKFGVDILLNGLLQSYHYYHHDFHVSHQIFLWLHVNFYGKIVRASVVRCIGISDTDNGKSDHKYVSKDIILSRKFSLTTLYSLAYVSSNKPLGLYVFNRDDDSTHVTLKHHLTVCNNHITHHPRKLVGIPYNSTSNKLGHAFAHLWQSVIQNHTLFALRGQNCVSGKLLPSFKAQQPYYQDLSIETMLHINEVPLYYPAVVENKLTTLRFVACGKRGVSPFPFGELVSIFDKPTWIGIVLCILAGTKAQKWLLRFLNVSQTKIFVEYLAVLFEQSASLSSDRGKHFAHRIMFGVSCLTAVVISNAYKNTNVYNMIVSRDTLLHTRFSELVDNKFQVLTIKPK